MRLNNISRRKFIASVLLATPCAVVADAKLVEPTWLEVRHQTIGSQPSHRFVQFSDLHHKGDLNYLESVVKTINELGPDFVCFTGDIIEDGKFLTEALEVLAGIKSPMFGVPGNHDYWSGVSFEPIKKCFAAGGGGWLLNEPREIAGGKINLIGLAEHHTAPFLPKAKPPSKNILLMHYPYLVNRLGDQKFDLILAGHSHGGQVRMPFYGPVFVPFGCDGYDLGLFQTKAGPLYVNPGIGYLHNFNFRFNCRPEITVFEI
jgi:predicted MPP superfamily phosphohydrolase